MAIYHCSVQIIGRSAGRSVCAASAYRSGQEIEDKETGVKHNYTHKLEVVYSEINLCKNAPSEYADRQTLWNAVQQIEKNKNAQLAREVQVALPKELAREQQIQTVREYVRENFVKEGMCADWSIHDKSDGNPHAHILLTTRPIKENGQWGQKEKKGYALDPNGQRIPVIDEKTGKQKVRIRKGKGEEKLWKRETVQANDWNSKEKLQKWRKSWADTCNKRLSAELQIDHRSFKDRGISQVPTIHEGYAAREMEGRGEKSDRCEINREIKDINTELKQVHQEQLQIKSLMLTLERQLKELKEIVIEKAKQLKELNLNDRIRDIMERRRNFETRRNSTGRAGEIADREREVAGYSGAREKGEGASILREVRNAISDSNVKEENARAERENREAERQRQDIERQRKNNELERSLAERQNKSRERSTEIYRGR